MIVAIWIIAITEVIRVIEQSLQLMLIIKDTQSRDNAYAEFIKSLKNSDKEFARHMLEELEKTERGTGD